MQLGQPQVRLVGLHRAVGSTTSRLTNHSLVKPGPHQQQCRSNVPLCCQKRQQCRTSFALKFRPFDKVERCCPKRQHCRSNKVACCFDNVASTLLPVWTGLYAYRTRLKIYSRQWRGGPKFISEGGDVNTPLRVK